MGSKKVVLHLLSKENSSDEKSFPFHQEKISIGVVESADLCLLGFEGVDPLHALIEVSRSQSKQEMDTVTLFDLASETGVWVNGKKGVIHSLNPGDHIQLGKAQLKFSLEEQTASIRIPTVGATEIFRDANEDLAPLLLEKEGSEESIFVDPEVGKQTLECVFSWCGCILSIRHFDGPPISMGNSAWNDFGIPFSKKRHIWVRRDSQGQVLMDLDPSMRGVLQSQGSLCSLDSLKQRSGIPLGKKDFCKISLGEMNFYLRWAPALPRLKSKRFVNRDPFFRKMILGSLVFSSMVLGILLKFPVHPTPMNVIQKRVDPTVTFIPLEKKPDEKKEELEKKIEKFIEKEASNKLEKQPEKKEEVKVQERKKSLPHKPHASSMVKSHPAEMKKVGAALPKQVAESPSPVQETIEEGSFDLLKGIGGEVSPRLKINKKSLKNQKKRSDLERASLQDEEVLHKNHLQRHAKAESLLEPSQNSSLDRVETGQKARGSGKEMGGGGKAQLDLRAPILVGGAGAGVDRDAISQMILDHQDEFRWCYEKEINVGLSQLSGQVKVHFVIDPSGKVVRSEIASTTLKDKNTENCILTIFKRLSFPKPPQGGNVEVYFPFQFHH